MTASNHVLAGAALAVGIKQPWLVIPMAVASHFVLDALPHFGVHGDEPLKRNKHPLFIMIVTIDVIFAVALSIVLPLMLGDVIPLWLLMSAMLLAWVPDAILVLSFFHEVRHGTVLPKVSRMQQFHARIQNESSHGIFFEILCVFGMTLLLGTLIA